MKKIGTLKGIPVVEGNVNEVTKNQIHYKESGGEIQLSKRNNDNKLNSITSGSSEGGGGSSKIKYYKCLTASSKAAIGSIDTFISYIKAYEYDNDMNLINCKFGTMGSLDTFNKPMMVDSIAFLPIEINESNTIMTFNNFEEFINLLSGENFFKDNFKEITEEEFYKID